MLTWQKWGNIPAVKNSRLHLVESDIFDRSCPGILDGLEELVKIIHPDITEKTLTGSIK